MNRWRLVAGIVLLVAGFVAFGEANAGQSVLLAMAAAAAGILMLCGRHVARALLITALVLPLGTTIIPWLWAVAAGCAVAAFVILGIARAKRDYPASDLPTVGDDAPFIEVEERTFQTPSLRGVATGTMVILALGVALGLVIGQVAVSITAGCLLFTMAVIWLLGSPPHYRVDPDGFSGRFVLTGEKTIRWRNVTALQTFQPRSTRYTTHLLHTVHSAERSVSFYGDLKESDELLRIIAEATGLTWP